MIHIENIVKAIAAAGFPMDAIDRDFMTEKEQEAFNRACREYGVKHSDELASRNVSPMTTEDMISANID